MRRRSTRVLVIRISALGDLALCEPIVRLLKNGWSQVDILTDERYAKWAGKALGVDRAWGYARHGADGGWMGLMAVARRIRKEGYDLVVDLQGKLRTRLLAALLRVPMVLTWRRRRGFRLLAALFGVDRPDHSIHQTESYRRALMPLELSSVLTPMRLRDAPCRPNVPTEGLRVGLCVGGAHATKRWPVDRFVTVVRQLAVAVPYVEFLAVGGREDRQRIDALHSGVPEVRWCASTVDFGLPEMARAVARLDLLISNDTGPAHLASGYGVPVVVIFGPTSWVRWAQQTKASRIIRHAVECAPCSNFGGARCPRSDGAWTCMRDLAPAQVTAAARVLLSEKS